MIDLNNARNKAWSLQAAGLYDFATLPWEQWKCNVPAMTRFRLLQINNYFINPEVHVTVELVSHVFNLSMEGETKFDKAPIKAIEKEFGVPDNPKYYYVIKKIKDADRKLQMEWYLENVQMLIKSEYMSDKNDAYLHAIEKGRKVGWAYIFYQKILSKIQETDRRKVHKTSRLGPVLAAMFNRVQKI